MVLSVILSRLPAFRDSVGVGSRWAGVFLSYFDDNAEQFPVGGGELGGLIRAHDWASTPLGPISSWPETLRASLNLLLPAKAQIVLFWGADYTTFYNDTYAPTIGDKHPRALGRPAREGWAELWDDLGPLLDGVWSSGETLSAKDRAFKIERHGYLEEVFFDISYSPVRDEAGAIAGILCIVSETTERVKAIESLASLTTELEERVARSTRERDGLWALSRDPFLIADTDGVWLACSPAWTFILGWSQEELLGKTSAWMEHPEDNQRTREEVESLAAHGTTIAFENRFRTKSGEWRWFSWNATERDGVIYCVARDITDQKRREAELEQAQEQLRQAQKMEAIGQLTGGIAHDFNNLLQGIVGSLDLVQKRISQGRTREIDRFIAGASASAGRAAALTHRLLAFARRQPLDPKPVRVNPLVASMEDLLRRSLGERVELELVMAGGLWMTLCDPNQLEAALLNLAINGRDAMPEGGRLTIETCNTHIDKIVARHRDMAPGQYVCIAVTDGGVGMDQDVAERAFEPFYTTKPIGQGTGLGLSMVYGFARQSEGTVKIYSELGKGTTVKIFLPRHIGAEQDDNEADLRLPAPRADDGETVLVVEDEPVVRGLICEVLADLGYQALEAADGQQGLDIALSGRRIDLMVTDIGLPGLNGRQLADAARERRPELKVLFMTGYAENAALSRGFLEPGMQMITKPFALEDLATRIREMIETG